MSRCRLLPGDNRMSCGVLPVRSQCTLLLFFSFIRRKRLGNGQLKSIPPLRDQEPRSKHNASEQQPFLLPLPTEIGSVHPGSIFIGFQKTTQLSYTRKAARSFTRPIFTAACVLQNKRHENHFLETVSLRSFN